MCARSKHNTTQAAATIAYVPGGAPASLPTSTVYSSGPSSLRRPSVSRLDLTYKQDELSRPQEYCSKLRLPCFAQAESSRDPTRTSSIIPAEMVSRRVLQRSLVTGVGHRAGIAAIPRAATIGRSDSRASALLRRTLSPLAAGLWNDSCLFATILGTCFPSFIAHLNIETIARASKRVQLARSPSRGKYVGVSYGNVRP